MEPMRTTKDAQGHVQPEAPTVAGEANAGKGLQVLRERAGIFYGPSVTNPSMRRSSGSTS